MKKPASVKALEDFGRTPLSKSFFMRDFLYSDIATIHGFQNIPDNPELAIQAGTKLCEELLEPLQEAFGRIAIRSAYRSCEVNDFGAKNKLGCGGNEGNYADHIWDHPDKDGRMGATACIVIPSFANRFNQPDDWKRLAWWIHDHLPYSTLFFFQWKWACNVQWREEPERRIDAYAPHRTILTKPGMANHLGSHRESWADIVPSE